jgi:Ca-activated chloride channel family protein
MRAEGFTNGDSEIRAAAATGRGDPGPRPYNLSVKRLLFLPLLLAAVAAAAQVSGDVPTYTESVGAEYIMLPVLVTDKKGKFIDGLRKEDFVVRVEQTKVDIDTFERDQSAPVSFAFLLDTSGSMGVADKLEHAKDAIRSIIRNRVPGDDFALFAFSEGEVRLVSDFSHDPAHLLRSLWDLDASGQTALFDAVAATPERMMKGRNNKRAILLFTDGVDNASRLTPVQMAEILQRVSVPVYPIGMKNVAFDALNKDERGQLSVENLQLLAGSSGGKMHLVAGDEDLRPLAAQLSGEVRQQYLLGFAASGKGDIRYRIVFVSVTKPGSWVVRTRRGYRGTAPGGS